MLLHASSNKCAHVVVERVRSAESVWQLTLLLLVVHGEVLAGTHAEGDVVRAERRM